VRCPWSETINVGLCVPDRGRPVGPDKADRQVRKCDAIDDERFLVGTPDSGMPPTAPSFEALDAEVFTETGHFGGPNSPCGKQARTGRKECEAVHKFRCFCWTASSTRRCLACQFGHDGDITQCTAPLATEHGSMRSPPADLTRSVPVFGKCQTWPGQPVVVGGARSRGTCPRASDAERPCRRSWSTQHAKSSAADRNQVLRLRRSGDVVLQHDLLECVEPKDCRH